jgi:hypothetical protein
MFDVDRRKIVAGGFGVSFERINVGFKQVIDVFGLDGAGVFKIIIGVDMDC